MDRSGPGIQKWTVIGGSSCVILPVADSKQCPHPGILIQRISFEMQIKAA
jgi:hypothetical protein